MAKEGDDYKYSNVGQTLENVERETENRSVGGSIPPLGTIPNHVTLRRILVGSEPPGRITIARLQT
jgi:hypothetical protein